MQFVSFFGKYRKFPIIFVGGSYRCLHLSVDCQLDLFMLKSCKLYPGQHKCPVLLFFLCVELVCEWIMYLTNVSVQIRSYVFSDTNTCIKVTLSNESGATGKVI